MKPLGLLLHTPAWARVAGANDLEGAPNDPIQFATFAKAAATRYLGMVPAWEVWNEQNTTWKPAPNVNAYAAVLATAYNAIKSVNSNLFVLAGGLAAADNIGTDIAPITFMNGLYAAGANKYFDALAMHPYAYPVACVAARFDLAADVRHARRDGHTRRFLEADLDH